MTTKPTIKEQIQEILEAVRIGGWYDANPDARESDYSDVDQATNQIIQLVKDKIIITDEPYEYINNKVELKRNDKREVRNKLRATQRQKVEL